MIRSLILLAVLPLLGAAPPRDPFAGRIAAAPQQCIDRSSGQPVTILDERTLIYDPGGKRLWRNDLIDRCPGLDPDDILIVESFGSQLCEHDLIRSLQRGTSIPGPACRLGKFTAYDKVAR